MAEWAKVQICMWNHKPPKLWNFDSNQIMADCWVDVHVMLHGTTIKNG
jgi:hypothetical protein